jgi:hypothetical protein
LSSKPEAPPAAAVRRAVIACHALLVVTAALVAGSLVPSFPGKAFAALVAIAPLLAPLPAFWRGRPGAAPWLALLLVVYIGAASIEVVARGASSLAANAALLAATAELALLLVLTRRR